MNAKELADLAVRVSKKIDVRIKNVQSSSRVRRSAGIASEEAKEEQAE